MIYPFDVDENAIGYYDMNIQWFYYHTDVIQVCNALL
jgi:hypothetical protein